MKGIKDGVDRLVVALVAAYALASFFAGCLKQDAPPPEPPIVVTVTDAGAADEHAEPFDAPGGGYLVPECGAACAALRKLGCEDGFTRPGEETCYAVCKRAQQSGVMDLKPGCVAKQTSIDGVRSCGTYRCLK